MESTRIENVIFENLLASDEYARKVLHFLEPEYYDNKIDKFLIENIKQFYNTHNKVPNKKILQIAVEDSQEFKKEEYDAAMGIISALGDPESNQEWLIERTEKFCKDKAIYNSIMTAIGVLDGRNTKFNREAIPEILKEALSVSFDKTVGHDYFGDIEERFKFYHLKEDRIPFDIDLFNKVTRGGVPRKTLNVVLAGTNVGKSLFLCHQAAACINQGLNALYITLEMSEERIAERIDCNLMGVSLDELQKMNHERFISKIDLLKDKTKGKLVIKEYPTSGAHTGHFKSLLNELRLKKNFIPDVIFVDYINICVSQRYKGNANMNSYFMIKAIAEELRGLAVEHNVPIWSATQTNRSGISNSDVEMTDTSESIGLPMTVDYLFAMVRTEELDKMGQLMIKQLKSRYGDINYFKRFVLGIDLPKFKLYNIDASAQNDLVDRGRTDDIPVFDKSPIGKSLKAKVSVDDLNFD